MTPTHRDAEFTSFVSAHSGTLRRTAYLLTGHAQAADDLLQDALARLRSRGEAAMATRSQS